MKFKNIKVNKTVLLVGCGQIGFRHFESLLDNKFIENIDVLEKQVDRAIFLNKRNKSKSAIIRMALRALDNTSDAEYSNLYNEF